jgi:DNA-binding MarR family transcriptional regulator
VDVVISRKGLSLLDKLDKKNEEIDSLLKGLSPDEAKALNRLLDKLREQE